MSALVPPPASLRWKLAEHDVQQIAAALVRQNAFEAAPDDAQRVKELLGGEIYYRKRLINTRDWQQPANLEASLHSSWKFYYHSLVWLAPLRRHYQTVPDKTFVSAYLAGVRGWLDQHGTPPGVLPTQQDPGDYTWYDMSTAWRTLILIGAIALDGPDDYWINHLRNHAQALADPTYYAKIGNHALHQDYALLSAALILDRDDYLQTALDRIQALRAISLDDEGVALEGSASYHLFNFSWWSTLRGQLELVASLIEGARRIEVPDMRPFLRYAVAPDGKIVPLGDSTLSKGVYHNVIREYDAEFVRHVESDLHLLYVLTCGQQGEPLPDTLRVFADGYWFSRANSGERAHARRQSHASLRFGPGLTARVHAHDDAGAVTFYPGGVRLLEDGGMFGYYGGDKREYVKSNLAHNTVWVEGRKYYRSAVATLESSASSAHFDHATVKITALEKTRWTRIIAHARDENFLFIQDHVAPSDAAYTQLFNLGDGFEVVELRPGRADVQNDKGDKASLIWLNADAQLGLVHGKTAPLMGWRSTFEGELHPITCITARHGPVSADTTHKSAALIVLLNPDETFADIALAQVQFGSDKTKFTLRRAGETLTCEVFFNAQEGQSTLLRNAVSE